MIPLASEIHSVQLIIFVNGLEPQHSEITLDLN